MTRQIGEILLFKGEKIFIPPCGMLSQYLKTTDNIKFVPCSTGCWRGYRGTWEVKENKLFLVAFTGYIQGLKKVNLNYIFPEQEEVFAYWFTGEAIIPIGGILNEPPFFEKKLVLEFNLGTLISEKEVDNSEQFSEKLLKRQMQKKRYEYKLLLDNIRKEKKSVGWESIWNFFSFLVGTIVLISLIDNFIFFDFFLQSLISVYRKLIYPFYDLFLSWLFNPIPILNDYLTLGILSSISTEIKLEKVNEKANEKKEENKNQIYSVILLIFYGLFSITLLWPIAVVFTTCSTFDGFDRQAKIKTLTKYIEESGLKGNELEDKVKEELITSYKIYLSSKKYTLWIGSILLFGISLLLVNYFTK